LFSSATRPSANDNPAQLVLAPFEVYLAEIE
jgi:hypothetical protein